MLDLTFLSGAIGSAQAAFDLVKSISSAKTAGEVDKKAAELTTEILSLQRALHEAFAAHVTVMNENQQLKSKLTQLEDFKAEAERYQLTEAWPGSIVYALKEPMSRGEPPHYICTNCYQSSEKSILHGAPDGKDARWTYYKCPRCKTALPTGYSGPVPAQYAPERPA